jgi:hypothetical protein
VVVIAGAISVGLFLFGRYTTSSKQSGSVELPTKSIAVLPFENFSEDKAFAFFADGVQGRDSEPSGKNCRPESD